MNTADITYRNDASLSLEQFIELYRKSTLAERRPADRPEIMQQMMDNASVTITAWADDELIGISRTLTDFGYVAYLDDLAVSASHQGLGIGKQLIAETRAALGQRPIGQAIGHVLPFESDLFNR